MSAPFPDAHALGGASAPPAVPVEQSLERASHLLDRWHQHLARHLQRGTIGLTLLAVILGVYLAAQWQSRPRPNTAPPEYRREIAAQTIQRLEAEQTDLKKQIADLRAALAARQQDAAAQDDLAHLSADLENQKLLAGTVAVRGPGVRIVLDDSSVKTIPPKEDPEMYLVHEYQLRDVVNALWAAGAEAISINGERIVAPTSIYCVGSTILINDTRTSPPYEFLVVGDPAQLETALTDAANLKSLKSRVKVYGVQFAVARAKEVVLPAYTGGLDVRHVLLTDAPLASSRGGAR